MINDIRIKPNSANIQFSGSQGYGGSINSTAHGLYFSSGSVKSISISGSGTVSFHKSVKLNNYVNTYSGSLTTLTAVDNSGQLIYPTNASVLSYLSSIGLVNTTVLPNMQISFGSPFNIVSSSKSLVWNQDSAYLSISGSIQMNNSIGAIRDKFGVIHYGFIPSTPGNNNGAIQIGSPSTIPGYKQNKISMYTDDTEIFRISGSLIDMFASSVKRNGSELIDESLAIAYSIVL